jgi:hypothetical protein
MSRNAAEIAQMLEDILPGEMFVSYDYRQMGEYLAQRGVLAIDALTDEQVYRLGETVEVRERGDGHVTAYFHVEKIRAALRRCATEGDEANG